MQYEPGEPYKLLIVEDEQDIRDSIRDFLAEQGFDVKAAATGHEALAIIEHTKLDVIVVDVLLPGGLNGVELVRQARTLQPGLGCVFISGRSHPASIDTTLDEFVGKPFRHSELLGCVFKMLCSNRPNGRSGMTI